MRTNPILFCASLLCGLTLLWSSCTTSTGAKADFSDEERLQICLGNTLAADQITAGHHALVFRNLPAKVIADLDRRFVGKPSVLSYRAAKRLYPEAEISQTSVQIKILKVTSSSAEIQVWQANSWSVYFFDKADGEWRFNRSELGAAF